MTPEQLIARKKKLASAARALVTGELGLVTASKNIERALRMLGAEAPKGWEVFGQFYKAIPPDIPLGIGRLQWPVDLLLAFDARLAKVEAEFRPVLIRACMNLIEEYG